MTSTRMGARCRSVWAITALFAIGCQGRDDHTLSVSYNVYANGIKLFGVGGKGLTSGHIQGSQFVVFPMLLEIGLRVDHTCEHCREVFTIRDGRLEMSGEGPCTIERATCHDTKNCQLALDANDYGSCLFEMYVTTTDDYSAATCFLVTLLDGHVTEQDYDAFHSTWQQCQDGL